MKLAMSIYIVFVFVTTLVFAVIVWQQTIKIEKKAMAAKQKRLQAKLEKSLAGQELEKPPGQFEPHSGENE